MGLVSREGDWGAIGTVGAGVIWGTGGRMCVSQWGWGLSVCAVCVPPIPAVPPAPGAIASTEVKLKLQEFLLSKTKEPGTGPPNHSLPQHPKCW